MSEFLNYLLQADAEAFRDINQVWTNSTFDNIMPFITQYAQVKYLALILMLIIIAKRKLFGLAVIVTCCFAVLIADVSTSKLIKPLVQRQRPNKVEKPVRLLIDEQKSYSFPSNHAANCFAFATVMFLTIEGGAGFLAFLLAALIGYSRVYVGVHYPLDILGGAVVGFVAGIMAFSLLTFVLSQTPEKKVNAESAEWKKKKYYANRQRKKRY